MPSSWSASLRFEMQFTGENINLWGDKLNAVLRHADYAVAGWLNKPITGDYALTTMNAGDDEARAAMLKFTGTLGVAANITIPSVSKAYQVWNATNFAIVITTGAGTTVSIDPGDIVWVSCDGANVKTPGYSGMSIKDFIAASVLAATGTLPAAIGNDGKALMVRAGTWVPSQILTTDLGDYLTKILGVQVALAAAL